MSRYGAFSVLDRFAGQVAVAGECWLWTGSPTGRATMPYGKIVSRRKPQPAHRFAYERFVGPIPAGLQIDHVKARGCASSLCVNPNHLEPVTARENLMRGNTVNAKNAAKAACPSGHPYDAENTGKRADGERRCKACARAYWRRRHGGG